MPSNWFPHHFPTCFPLVGNPSDPHPTTTLLGVGGGVGRGCGGGGPHPTSPPASGGWGRSA